MASTDAWLTQDPLPVIINNKPYPTSQTYEVHRVDSASPSVLHNVASCSPEDANAAVDACWAAFPAWRDTPYGERRKIIQKAHTLLQERLQKYAQLEVEETSSGKGFAQFDMGLAIGALEESAAVVSIALRGEIAPPQANGKRALIYREPYGVVLGIVSIWSAVCRKEREKQPLEVRARSCLGTPPLFYRPHGTPPSRSVCARS